MSQLEIFDYSQLSVEMASDVRAASERIKLRLKRSVDDIIAIGQDLIAVKEQLGHGNFIEWINAEFKMSRVTATRFMAVAEKFSDKCFNVKHLPPSVLYELAAPSTPEPVRQQALQKVENGETIAVKEVQEWKRKAKAAEQREKKAQQQIDEAERRTSFYGEKINELSGELKQLKTINQGLEAEIDHLVNQEPEVIEHVIEKIPDGYSSLEEAITDQESKLAELKAEAEKAEKEVKRFKQRKKAHENRLQNLSQEIADKDPMIEAVRTARFQATQYRELTSKYIEQLLAIGFETWIDGNTVAPADALKDIDETSKWLIGRVSDYLTKAADKSGRQNGSNGSAVRVNAVDIRAVDVSVAEV